MNVLYFNLFSSNLLSLGKPVILELLKQKHKVRVVNVDPYVTQADRNQLLKAGIPREQGRQPFIQHFHMKPFLHDGLVDEQRQPMKELLSWADVVFCPREGGHPQDGLMHEILGMFRGHSNANTAFVLQHGLIHQDAIDNNVYFPFESDWLIVWSEYYRNFLLQQGMSEEHFQRTIALGCPKFDQLINMVKQPEYILVTPNTHWSRYSQEANDQFFLALEHTCKQFPKESILIKTHPAERHFGHLPRYEELEKRYTNCKLVVDNVSIPDLLAKAKVLIHTCSTVAIEAVIADVPVITWNFTDIPTGIDDCDATYYIEEIAEIRESLVAALIAPQEKQQQRLQLAQKHNGECDGKATQRVCDFITQAISVPMAPYKAMYDEYWSNWHRDVKCFTDPAFTEKIVQIFKPESVLDAGCGPGENLRKFLELGVDAKGVEYSHWMVTNKLKDLVETNKVIEGSIADLSCFKSNAFDVVFCIEVLEHLPPETIPQAISELARVAKGYIVCTIAFSASAALDGPEANIKRTMFTDLKVHATVESPEWWYEQFQKAAPEAISDPILARALTHKEERFGNTRLYVFKIGAS